eukprot:jgi/Astpho2/3692/fgenesh1_pg.00060_%23_17_t
MLQQLAHWALLKTAYTAGVLMAVLDLIWRCFRRPGTRAQASADAPGGDRGDLEAGLRAPGQSARLHRGAAQQSTPVAASPAPARVAAGAGCAGGVPLSGRTARRDETAAVCLPMLSEARSPSPVTLALARDYSVGLTTGVADASGAASGSPGALRSSAEDLVTPLLERGSCPAGLKSERDSTSPSLGRPSLPGTQPRFVLERPFGQRAPQVVGVENPATVFKENKPLRMHGTPFERRVESLMEKERDFCTRMALTDGNQL